MVDRFFAHFANQRIGAALVLSLIAGTWAWGALIERLFP